MSVATIKHHHNSLLSSSERYTTTYVILNNFKSKYICELINNYITIKIMYISNHFKSE